MASRQFAGLFRGLRLFISRECPRPSLEFIIRSFQGQVRTIRLLRLSRFSCWVHPACVTCTHGESFVVVVVVVGFIFFVFVAPVSPRWVGKVLAVHLARKTPRSLIKLSTVHRFTVLASNHESMCSHSGSTTASISRCCYRSNGTQ